MVLELVSLFGSRFHVRSGSGEGTPCRHGNIRVCILSLRAAYLVQAVPGRVGLELCVHIPADFLRCGLWIVKLLLGLALEWLKLVLEHLELLFGSSLRLCSGCRIGANLGGLLRDSDHWKQKRRSVSSETWNLFLEWIVQAYSSWGWSRTLRSESCPCFPFWQPLSSMRWSIVENLWVSDQKIEQTYLNLGHSCSSVGFRVGHFNIFVRSLLDLDWNNN